MDPDNYCDPVPLSFSACVGLEISPESSSDYSSSDSESEQDWELEDLRWYF